jgi:N-acetylneuraminate synthase
MIINRQIEKYLVFVEDSILAALDKIHANKSGFVVTVDENRVLKGILTDGDFRACIIESNDFDLTQAVEVIHNPNPRFAFIDGEIEIDSNLFDDTIRQIPLLDTKHRVVAIATPRSNKVYIDEFEIAPSAPAFVIAEIGNNHNGSLNTAKKLVDAAAQAGANCIKFQLRDLETLYRNQGNPNTMSEDLGSQHLLDQLNRFQLSKEDMEAAFDYSRTQGILPLCTPWDLESLTFLENQSMSAYKIASADLTNHDLICATAETLKPIILSTGMSTEEEIQESVSILRNMNASYVLLHCNSTYPTPFKDVNIRYMDRLREIGQCPIGYSGHERGYNVAVAAVARGACVIEKHFTLDRSMEGDDHKVSLLPNEMSLMITAIREVEESLGSHGKRSLSQGELLNRETLAKSLVAACNIQKGMILTEDLIDIKSPGTGLQPNQRARLCGKTIQRDINKGDFFSLDDIQEIKPRLAPFNFRRPWGIPVRYHDITELASKESMDLVEFHFSFKDLMIDPNDIFDDPLNLDLVIHAPELYGHGYILNLAADSADERKRAIHELQGVIDVTRQLIPYFKKADRPLMVVNMGGFSNEHFFDPTARPGLYDRIGNSLDQLDDSGVEILAQTMPPFPWHFGGQQYHNLFLDQDDFLPFCIDRKIRLCLDISHSKLACNHAHKSFIEFVDQVACHTAHLHLSDASGVDGEGLQIGEGEIDFAVLADQMDRWQPDASFIPEIWQGHKYGGSKFWTALDRLEKWF